MPHRTESVDVVKLTSSRFLKSHGVKTQTCFSIIHPLLSKMPPPQSAVAPFRIRTHIYNTSSEFCLYLHLLKDHSYTPSTHLEIKYWLHKELTISSWELDELDSTGLRSLRKCLHVRLLLFKLVFWWLVSVRVGLCLQSATKLVFLKQQQQLLPLSVTGQ